MEKEEQHGGMEMSWLEYIASFVVGSEPEKKVSE